ncbi:hypothetical protein LTR84_009268 [Exophiala bonariae]|uniref:Uncharacterized protein n=1 Tax=Exophiala bonariae TaxID=1690606 RepID=A0AAV9MV83_9EURO|nr:hypothetical protein LTR84_009268 [Exophiala bonariae]
MLLSSRSSPPKPLKITGSERPQYLSVKYLLPRTPIPSPSLPSILPRHGKKPPKLNSRKIVRSLLWLSVLIGVWYLLSYGRSTTNSLSDLTFLTSTGKTYQIVEASELPNHATPLSVTDYDGRNYWTISIPSNLGFPLPHAAYADVCSQVEDVARHVAGSGWQEEQHLDYYHNEPNYIDVKEAQSSHFLPPSIDISSEHHGLPICERSLTYILDAADPGLGSTLMGLWLSYSLAEREDRAFFIDDTHFPYGSYSTFFNGMPEPKCRPPPSAQRVPCPHQANHLVVSAATSGWMFGAAFQETFSQREIFDMARHGYEALFQLRSDDAEYVRERVLKLRTTNDDNNNVDEDEDEDTVHGLVGIHLRRGDRHPFSFAHQLGYLPPETYLSAARKLVGPSSQWTLLLASDDADMYDHNELPGTIRAQTRISLASKKKLSSGLGWEGGFFKDAFWALGLPEHVTAQKGADGPQPTKGRPSSSSSSETGQQRDDTPGPPRPQPPRQMLDVSPEDRDRDYRTHPTKEALQLREFLGRAYLLDLAMLAHSDKVVCGVSSFACRILAVMLGWDRAFDARDWMNVDGSFEWIAFE